MRTPSSPIFDSYTDTAASTPLPPADWMGGHETTPPRQAPAAPRGGLRGALSWLWLMTIESYAAYAEAMYPGLDAFVDYPPSRPITEAGDQVPHLHLDQSLKPCEFPTEPSRHSGTGTGCFLARWWSSRHRGRPVTPGSSC